MLKILYCFGFALVLLSQLSCSKKESRGGVAPARPVHTAQAINADVPIYIDAIGILAADLSVDIKSQVTGKIISAKFTEGQSVKEGDTLFEIDTRSYQALLDQSKALLKQNNADMSIALWIAEKDKKIAATGAMSAQDYARILATYEKTLGMVEADKATVWQNEISLEYCKITSPIAGITGTRQIDPGNIVTENNGPTLVNIKSIDPLNVDFSISERNYSILRDSMNKGSLKVIVSTESFGEGNSIIQNHYTGTLDFLNNTIDPATGNIYLRASIPNPKKEIWPGQFVSVRLIYYIKKNAILVPNQAVNMGLKGNFIFVVKDNKAQLLWVKTGLKEGDYTIIEGIVGEGKLSSGEEVVTVGQMGLVPNAAVNVVGKDTFEQPVSDTSLIQDSKNQ
ncbi:MAG: efflux RND transporter periplasmic adaptor subunit [Lentisphaerota bacterium]